MNVYLVSSYVESVGYRHDDKEGPDDEEYVYVIASDEQTALDFYKTRYPERVVSLMRRLNEPRDEVIGTEGI